MKRESVVEGTQGGEERAEVRIAGICHCLDTPSTIQDGVEEGCGDGPGKGVWGQIRIGPIKGVCVTGVE